MKWYFINFLFTLQMVLSKNIPAWEDMLAQQGQVLDV